MRQFMKRITSALLALLAVLLLAGCVQREAEADPGSGSYYVYYLDKNVTELEHVLYSVSAENKEELISELLENLMQVPSNIDMIPAIGDDVRYESFSLDGSVLYLYFDERYGEMKPERKTLCNAALTETLTQVAGVDHVGIYTGGQPLSGQSGAPLGPFTENDFVNSISDVNRYESAELTLYFADAAGKTLVEETRTVTYRVDTPPEQLVVEQLIAGPQQSGSLAVLSSDTRLLSVSVNENVCYLNFSKEFLTPVPNENPYLTIYALVNSLSELTTVQRVQIAVEGSQAVLFRDIVSLDTLFERNLDYIPQ